MNWRKFEGELKRYAHTLGMAEACEALGDRVDERDLDMKFKLYRKALRCYAAIGDSQSARRVENKMYLCDEDAALYMEFNSRWLEAGLECDELVRQQETGMLLEASGDAKDSCGKWLGAAGDYLCAYAWYGGAGDWHGMARVAGKLGFGELKEKLAEISRKPEPSEADIAMAEQALVEMDRWFGERAKKAM
ncbi:MAG: hypothetical protein QW548_00710 [Candidatus Aenigmatarchaeota archaeon]